MRTVRGRDQIWLMEADGMHAVELRGAAGVDYEEPSWSENGKHIAFAGVSVGRGGIVVGTHSWIEVMNTDGSSARLVTSKRGSAWNPVWLADDAGIAWLSGNSYSHTGSVFAARANGTDILRVLRARAEQFAWSSAGISPRGCK